MPQETDGSELISLLWAAWIYWNIYWWLDHLSSLQQQKKAGPQPSAARPSFADKAVASLSQTATSANLDMLVHEILQRDGTAIEDFLRQKLEVYEAVVAAFDSGDRHTLRSLVSPDVYVAFSDAMMVREAERKSEKTVFSQIEPPEIVAGLVEDTRMEVSIRFAGEFFKLPRHAGGPSAERAPHKYRSADIWTFGRTPRERTWRVVATEAGA